jgi:hypothetical protein
MVNGDTCPQGDTYQKPVTVSSFGGAILDIGYSIAQIRGRSKHVSLLLRAIGALASGFPSRKSAHQCGQFEERTHVGNDFVLFANVPPFKGVFADLESVSQ